MVYKYTRYLSISRSASLLIILFPQSFFGIKAFRSLVLIIMFSLTLILIVVLLYEPNNAQALKFLPLLSEKKEQGKTTSKNGKHSHYIGFDKINIILSNFECVAWTQSIF